jgi:hypothetical protein
MNNGNEPKKMFDFKARPNFIFLKVINLLFESRLT